MVRRTVYAGLGLGKVFHEAFKELGLSIASTLPRIIQDKAVNPKVYEIGYPRSN